MRLSEKAVRRRDFIKVVAGSAVPWPSAAGAQNSGRTRRIGILMPFPDGETEYHGYVRVFREEMGKLGWTEGRNIRFDERWTADDMDRVRFNAANLVESKPDAIVSTGGRVIPILMKLSKSIPILIPGGTDPVGIGWIKSLARPGGNVTGFATLESSIFGKMLQTLKQVVPSVSRVALINNPDNLTTAFFVRWFEIFARQLGLQPVVVYIHGLADFDAAVQALAKQSTGGILFPPDVTIAGLHEQVVTIVARHRIPAIYTERFYVASGGLMSYASSTVERYRGIASYADRILRGENPGDLPYQQPTRYNLVINLKTAKTLGLTIPDNLLALADEVIE